MGMVQGSCSPAPTPPPAGHYDLVAASIDWKPATIYVGDPISGEHLIRNAGKDTIPGRTYTVHLYLDGKLVSFDHATGDRQPGTFATYGCSPGHAYLTPTQPGRIPFRLVVDEENNVPEVNEANNVIEGWINVLPRP